MILFTKKSDRVNDNFIKNSSIDASPVTQDISHPLIKGTRSDQLSRFQADFYKKIALDIVTETVFDYPYPCITEKTLRPFGSKRMFILLGPAGVLSMLKTKGFETFSDIIDESYDAIAEPGERFHRVVESIEKFVSLDLEYIREYYQKNQSRFEHNFYTLTTLRAKELSSVCSSLGISEDNVYNKENNAGIRNYR